MREAIIQDPSSPGDEFLAELDLGGRAWTDNATEFVLEAPKIHRWLVEIFDQGRWPSFVKGDITSLPSAWRGPYGEHLSLVFTPDQSGRRPYAVRFYFFRGLGNVNDLAQDFQCSPEDIHDFMEEVGEGGLSINDEDVGISCRRSFGIGSFIEFHDVVRDNLMGCIDEVENLAEMMESYCRGDRPEPHDRRGPRPSPGRRRRRSELL